MRKRLVLLIFTLFAGNCINAQFAVTPDGLMNRDDITTNAVIIKYQGTAREDLLETYRDYAETYSKKRRGLSFFDNGQDGFMIKFVNVGRFGTHMVKTGSASFVLLFSFEDETVIIRAQNLKLSRISLYQGGAKQYIYTKRGRLSRHGKFLKPMVEREVNLHFDDIVETVSSLIAI